MEDYTYEVCPEHGPVAWDADRPWDAFWCCEEQADADAKPFAEAVFGW